MIKVSNKRTNITSLLFILPHHLIKNATFYILRIFSRGHSETKDTPKLKKTVFSSLGDFQFWYFYTYCRKGDNPAIFSAIWHCTGILKLFLSDFELLHIPASTEMFLKYFLNIMENVGMMSIKNVKIMLKCMAFLCFYDIINKHLKKTLL